MAFQGGGFQLFVKSFECFRSLGRNGRYTVTNSFFLLADRTGIFFAELVHTFGMFDKRHKLNNNNKISTKYVLHDSSNLTRKIERKGFTSFKEFTVSSSL